MKKILDEAMLFAIKAHGDQKYGKKPYHVHLLDVVNVLRRFHSWEELDQDMINAGWLHDTIEDTDTTYFTIDQQFGNRVANLVDAVTKAQDPDLTRKEANAITYPKIRHFAGAITLKLADRIANVENCVSHDRVGRIPGRLFKMYFKERDTFEAELRGRCAGESYINLAMWDRLDSLYKKGHAALLLR